MVEIDEKALKGLHPFQIEAVRFVEEKGGYVLIADDCGIGKTIEAIGITKLHIHEGPFVIVCTATMKLKWAREIKKWTGYDAHIIYGETESHLPKAKYYIINYNILGRENAEDRKRENKAKAEAKKKGLKYTIKQKDIRLEGWWTELVKKNPYAIFPDESHRLGNDSAIWSRCFIELVRQSRPYYFVPLSGTPIRKRPRNFFTILNLLRPNVFPNKYKFLFRYCDPRHNGFGWQFNGATNVEELNTKLNKFMIRRMKEDVLPELPHLIPSFIPLELDSLEKKNYDNLNEEFISFLDTNVKNKIIINQHISALKQGAYLAKRNSVFQWIDDYMEEHDKLVIAAWHKMVIKDLYDRYGKEAVKIDGSVTGKDRQLAEDLFQTDDKIKMIIIQIDAGGEGITLTASDGIVFVEFPDTPGQVKQAGDRIARIGQVHDSINAYFLFAAGTVENDIADALEKSSWSMSKILDGKDESMFGSFISDFDEIIVKNSKKPL